MYFTSPSNFMVWHLSTTECAGSMASALKFMWGYFAFTASHLDLRSATGSFLTFDESSAPESSLLLSSAATKV